MFFVTIHDALECPRCGYSLNNLFANAEHEYCSVRERKKKTAGRKDGRGYYREASPYSENDPNNDLEPRVVAGFVRETHEVLANIGLDPTCPFCAQPIKHVQLQNNVNNTFWTILQVGPRSGELVVRCYDCHKQYFPNIGYWEEIVDTAGMTVLFTVDFSAHLAPVLLEATSSHQVYQEPPPAKEKEPPAKEEKPPIQLPVQILEDEPQDIELDIVRQRLSILESWIQTRGYNICSHCHHPYDQVAKECYRCNSTEK
jgi:hypothetical protein